MQFRITQSFRVLNPIQPVIFRRLFNSAMLILCTILKHTTLSEGDILNEIVDEFTAYRAGQRKEG